MERLNCSRSYRSLNESHSPIRQARRLNSRAIALSTDPKFKPSSSRTVEPEVHASFTLLRMGWDKREGRGDESVQLLLLRSFPPFLLLLHPVLFQCFRLSSAFWLPRSRCKMIACEYLDRSRRLALAILQQPLFALRVGRPRLSTDREFQPTSSFFQIVFTHLKNLLFFSRLQPRRK